MNRRRWLLAVAVIACCVCFGLSWWLVSTDARPHTGDSILTGWARVQILLSLPLRLAVTPFVGWRYMRHAHDLILVLNFLTPLFWLAVMWAAWSMRTLWKRFTPATPARSGQGVRLHRRAFLATAATGVIGAGGGVAGADSLFLAPQRVRVRPYTHRVPWLPGQRETLRIAHVSDTHLGPFVSRPFLEGVMEQVNELEPDLVFLTGDYVHRHPSFIHDGIGMFAMLEPRLGSVAVLGNHDHWEGADACRDAFARVGIPLLDNDRVFLTDRGLSTAIPQRHGLCIAGLGDLWEDAVDPGHALRDVPDELHRLVLSHNPDTAALPIEARVDLMCSGHTHGGQVRLPIFGAPVSVSRHGDRFLGGLCEGDGFPVIVSRGLGLAGIPVRFRVPPELGLITLTRAERA